MSHQTGGLAAFAQALCTQLQERRAPRAPRVKLSDVHEALAKTVLGHEATWRTILALKSPQASTSSAPAGQSPEVLFVHLSNGDRAAWLNEVCLASAEAQDSDDVEEVAYNVAQALRGRVVTVEMDPPTLEDWNFDDVYALAKGSLSLPVQASGSAGPALSRERMAALQFWVVRYRQLNADGVPSAFHDVYPCAALTSQAAFEEARKHAGIAQSHWVKLFPECVEVVRPMGDENSWDIRGVIRAEFQRSVAQSFHRAKVLWGLEMLSLHCGDTFSDEDDMTSFLLEDLTCSKCGSSLDAHGYCTDMTCPYSDWPQEVGLDDLESRSASYVEHLYGVKKRVHTEPAEDAAPEADLKLYHVSLHEEPGDKFTTIFECNAEDAEHAYEQAQDAYPGAELLTAVLIGWAGVP